MQRGLKDWLAAWLIYVLIAAGSLGTGVALPEYFRLLVRSHNIEKEKTMNPTRIPGNEPDPGDMSTEPGTGGPADQPGTLDLPDEDAEKLGNFA